MRLISVCDLQRLGPHHFSREAKNDPDTLAIKRTKAGSGAAAAGSMRTADGSTAAALDGPGAETLAEQTLMAAEDYAGAAEAYNLRTEVSAERSAYAERRYPLAGFGLSRTTINLSSGMRETKDYAGAAEALNMALTALKRATGGAAFHSMTRRRKRSSHRHSTFHVMGTS
jgi:hypothetical protein